MADAAHRILELADHALSSPFPLRVRAWDGSEAGPPGAPVLVFRRRRALRRLLWRPGELGLARAWVAGELDVDGDLYTALDLLAGSVWERGEPDVPAGRAHRLRTVLAALGDPATYRLARAALALTGPLPAPAPPPEEVRRRTGIAHTRRRDKAAIAHHYDVGNDFYALVLGPSMVYSCAVWTGPDSTLEEAQRAKLDLVCRKLGLREGQRLLDVGCGWGSLVLHAVEHYGVRATGITLSSEQAAYARKRIAEAGLTDRIDIRVQDYRDVAGRALRRGVVHRHGGTRRQRPVPGVRAHAARPAQAGRAAAQPPDRAAPAARRGGVPGRRVHRPVRLPRRRTGARWAAR